MDLTPTQQKEAEELKEFLMGGHRTFIEKGAKYGNSWHELSADSIKELIRMKLARADMTNEYEDIIVYTWMLREKNKHD